MKICRYHDSLAWRREVELAALIPFHANIANALGVSQNALVLCISQTFMHSQFLVREKVRLRTVLEHMAKKHKCFPKLPLIIYSINIANALYFIHMSNIAHRDLDWRNFLFSYDGVLKVAFNFLYSYSVELLWGGKSYNV